MLSSLRLALLLALCACAAGLPAAASADSIVYLKGGEVWIANADGSGARQFTLYPYNWRSPSEADDGTVVVAGGLQRTNPDGSDSSGSSEIYRFQPDGNQIGDFTPTYGSYSTPACPTYPPDRVRVSPDGSRIAYGIYFCAAGGYHTALWTPAGSTNLNFPNQSIGQQDFWNPIWIDSNRFAMSHFGPPVFGAHWAEHPVSDGDNVGGGWSEPTQSDNAADAVISRDGGTAVVFFNDASSYSDGHPRTVSMLVYHNASVPSDWTHNDYGNPVCTVTLPAVNYPDVERIDPSLSPDGTKVLWGDSAGVEVMSLGDLNNSCAGRSDPATLIPGGSEPFYSGGNEQPQAAGPRQPGGTTQTTNTGGGSQQTNNNGQQTTTTLKPVARFKVVTKHPRRGRKVKFDASKSSEPGGRIVSFSWSFGDHKKGKGRKPTHRYRKARRFKVTLTVRDAAGRTAKVSHTVRVKR